MKIAPPWRLIFRAPSLTRIHIEIRSPLRVKEHQSGFPQIRQGLRRLTRLKTFEFDVVMASLPAASFSDRGRSPIRQSCPLATRIGGAPQAPPSITQPYPRATKINFSIMRKTANRKATPTRRLWH